MSALRFMIEPLKEKLGIAMETLQGMEGPCELAMGPGWKPTDDCPNYNIPCMACRAREALIKIAEVKW